MRITASILIAAASVCLASVCLAEEPRSSYPTTIDLDDQTCRFLFHVLRAMQFRSAFQLSWNSLVYFSISTVH